MAWILPNKRDAIYRRDNFTCGYCGRKYHADKARLTLDHIKPRKQGGTNKPNNLVTCCDYCNTRKGNKTLTQYRKWLTLNIERRINWTVIENRINRFRRRKLIY